MDIRQLVKTDLNLLVTLYVLFEESSVSNAAEKLFVTQSAVSKSLSRLRLLFDDPLFTRSANKLIATPFLENLAPQLVSILINVGYILEPVEFNPRQSKAEITLAITETVELVVMPLLLAYLYRDAPGISIVSTRYDSKILRHLAEGTLDFSIGMEYAEYPPEFSVRQFLSTSPVIFARTGHPLCDKALNLQALFDYPRLNVKMPDERHTEFFHRVSSRHIEETKKWPIAFETENLLTALSVVSVTDSMMLAPDILTKMIAASTDLQALNFDELAIETFNFVLVSHERSKHSAMHQWFSAVLLAISQQIMATVANK